MSKRSTVTAQVLALAREQGGLSVEQCEELLPLVFDAGMIAGEIVAGSSREGELQSMRRDLNRRLNAAKQAATAKRIADARAEFQRSHQPRKAWALGNCARYGVGERQMRDEWLKGL